MAKKIAKAESGGARLIRKGRLPVTIGLEPDEAALIDAARGWEPRTKFLVRAALDLARKITEK